MSYLNFISGDQFSGALATLNGNWLVSGDSLVDWNDESYDSGSWHDTSSNNSRLAVPSGVALVRAVTSTRSPNVPEPLLRKNNAAFTGRGGATSGVGNCIGAASAVVPVSAADYFEVVSSVDVTDEARSWFAIEKLDATTKYALVSKTATQSLTLNTNITIAYDAETADTDSWHDNVTNNSRLTVPSGVTLVRVSAGSDTTSANGSLFIRINKNGSSTFAGHPIRCQQRNAVVRLGCVSAPLVVTPGDYFEVVMQAASAARTLNNNEFTWFCIEEIPASIHRALVTKNATQNLTSGVEATVDWEVDQYDTSSIHDTGSNISRLTVPAGCTKARLSFNFVLTSLTGNQQARVLKNGSTFDGMPFDESNVSGTDCLNALGAWVSVTPGDYFECLVTTGANFTLPNNDDRNWFCMECR